MNTLTIHGNVTADPEPLRYTGDGNPVAHFSVAVNRRRYDRTTGQSTDLDTVYHRIVAFGALAENIATLTRGTLVTVTGELADDSWTPDDGKRVYRTQLIAADVAVSLRFASVVVTKNQRRETQAGPVDG
jgi:single-strand DNA-binding protein